MSVDETEWIQCDLKAERHASISPVCAIEKQ